jgi:predicted transcriptional regulator
MTAEPAARVPVSVQCSPEMVQAIDELARHWERNRAQTIRTILNTFLRETGMVMPKESE